MFIRTKSRKNSSGKIKKYAYLVSSKRRRKSKKNPKQRVIAYLGRVIELNNHQQSSTIINKKDINKVILVLFDDLLTSNGFKKNKDALFQKDNILIDITNKTVNDAKTGKNICIKVNEGYISKYSLKKIFPYSPPEATEREVGLDFAKKLVSAGLKPSEEAFLTLYSLISKGFHRK
jgi:hypothetical protein